MMGASSHAQRSRPTYRRRLRFIERPAGLGGAHQPRREVHCVAHHRVLATERWADLTGEDMAAVHADLVLELEARAAQLGLELEGESGGVCRRVLVSDWSPEGDDQLRALDGDVAAHHEAVVPSGETDKRGRVGLQLVDGRVEAGAIDDRVEPKDVDEDDDRAAVFGGDRDSLRPLSACRPRVGRQERAECCKVDVSDRRRPAGQLRQVAGAELVDPPEVAGRLESRAGRLQRPAGRGDRELTALGLRLGERGQLARATEHDEVGALTRLADTGEHEGVAVSADRHTDLDPSLVGLDRRRALDLPEHLECGGSAREAWPGPSKSRRMASPPKVSVSPP